MTPQDKQAALAAFLRACAVLTEAGFKVSVGNLYDSGRRSAGVIIDGVVCDESKILRVSQEKGGAGFGNG